MEVVEALTWETPKIGVLAPEEGSESAKLLLLMDFCSFEIEC